MSLSLPTLHVSRQQELSNLLQEKKYLKALGLAISLDQPHTVLTVIKGSYLITDGRTLSIQYRPHAL